MEVVIGDLDHQFMEFIRLMIVLVIKMVNFVVVNHKVCIDYFFCVLEIVDGVLWFVGVVNSRYRSCFGMVNAARSIHGTCMLYFLC